MPPIEIPTVKRIATEAPQSVGRIQTQIPDGSAGIRSTGTALEGVAEQAIKYRNQVADQHADTVATDVANQFEQRWKTELYGDPQNPGKVGAKFQTGNPTDIYKKFDDTMQGHLDELSSNDQWDTETRNLVNRRLGKKAEEFRLQTLTDYGNQQHKYDDGVTGSGIKLAQQAMPDASVFIQPGDDSTLAPLQTKIANIQNLRIAQALRYGSAQEDPNGQTAYTAPDGTVKRVTLGPTTQIQIKKDLSDGLYATMDNLVKLGTSDSLAKAAVMKDKFGDMLDPLHRDKLTKDFEASRIKAAAFVAAEKARTSGNPAAALQGADPEVRHKALSIINEDQRNMEQIKGRQSKANFNPLMQHVLEVMHSDTPYSGTNALEADPLFVAMKDKVTDPKQLQALYHAVEKPKESSQAALTKMQNLITGQDPNNDITKMTPSDFALFKVGLNGAAQKKYDGIYEKAHTQTGAQIMTSYKYADKELADQLVGINHIQRNQWGKFAGRDEAKWIQARQEMEDYIATSDHPMKPDEIKQHVREYAVHVQTGEALKPITTMPKFNGGNQNATPQPPAGNAPPVSVFGAMTPATKFGYIQQWRKANNTRETPSSKTLEDFIKKDTRN